MTSNVGSHLIKKEGDIGFAKSANGFKESDIEIKIVGSRPGEKLFEELLNEEEVRRTVELEHHYVVKPAFPYIYGGIDYDYNDAVPVSVDNGYRSDREELMSSTEINAFLLDNDLL